MFPIDKRQTCLNNLDSFDFVKFSDISTKSKLFKEAQEKGSKSLPSFPSLQMDIWGSLYKYLPQLKNDADINNDLILNHELLKRLTQDNEFQSMREYTKMDELASAVNTIKLSGNIQEMLKELNNTDVQKIQQELEELLQKLLANEFKLDGLRQKLEQLQQGDQSDQQQVQKMEQKLKRTEKAVEKAQTDVQQAQQQMRQKLEQKMASSAFKQELNKAISSALNESKELIEGVDTLSGGDKNCGLLNKLKLIELIAKDPQLRNVIKLAGNMKNIAFSKRKVKTNKAHSRQEIQSGNSIENLLPNELLLYSNLSTRLMFLKRLAEGECLCYSPKAKEKLGEGPMVVCVDISGSMRATLGNLKGEDCNRAEWAKAVAYALWRIAKKQRRSYQLIEFNGQLGFNKEIGERDIMRLLKVEAEGGTTFTIPLDTAVGIIKAGGKFKKADIIFITDGEANLNFEQIEIYNKMKITTGTHIYSIQLSTDTSITSLKRFSDMVIRYDGSEGFTEIFKRV